MRNGALHYCVFTVTAIHVVETLLVSYQHILTQPELIIDVAKTCRVVLPVSEKLQFTVLTSKENLRMTKSQRWIV